MITRTATLFSLAGVLVAGSAAALVNSQVLQDSNDPTSDPSSIVLASSTTLPQTTSTVTAVTVAPSTAAIAGAPASTLAVFSVGDAGVVSTDSAGGVLVLASAVPNPGWAVASTGSNGFGGVGVTFRSADVEVVFNAVLVDGQVVTSVGSSFIDSGSNTSIDDDDRDDDDRDDDDRDDDDDDRDDDDRDDDDRDDDHGGGDDD